MAAYRADRDVEQKGASLRGRKIDFVVCGGIGSIESARLIRELRRYGAEVRVIMSPAAHKFVQPLVFEWASGQEVITESSGKAEHISSADAVLIAPCTLDFMAKLSLGLASDTASTLLHSRLGRVPVLLLPSMHRSLQDSPSFKEHYAKLKLISKVHFLNPRFEEDKVKMPEPVEAVALGCHLLNKQEGAKSLVLSGPTRSYLDDVRFLSNISTGELGVRLAEELYRSGLDVHVVSGPSQFSFPSYVKLNKVESVGEMKATAQHVLNSFSIRSLFFAAAVLDFEVQEKLSQKRSSQKNWSVDLVPTEKIINQIGLNCPVRIGFKLESRVSEQDFIKKVQDWSVSKSCDLVVANRVEELGKEHKSYFINPQKALVEFAQGKKEIASRLAYFEKLIFSQKERAAEKPKPSSDAPSVTLV